MVLMVAGMLYWRFSEMTSSLSSLIMFLIKI